MARVTSEDCLEKIPNLFDIVLIGAKRARQLSTGAEAQLDWNRDKDTVMALREVAAGLVDESILNENVELAAKDALSSRRAKLSKEVHEEDFEMVAEVLKSHTSTEGPAGTETE